MAILPATWELYDTLQALLEAPAYHLLFEAVLIIWIIKLLFSKAYALEKTVLTEKEKEELIQDYQPEPLIPHVPDDHPVLQAIEKNIISGRPGKIMTVNGKCVINMASLNFLGFMGDEMIRAEAEKAVDKYGVGSCGPRGFYGTMDVHLELEKRIAKFTKTEEAVLYSYGFACISSAIPTYSKRGDVIFCDEGVNFCIQQGLIASRSVIKYFKHNDTEDLERLLLEQAKEDERIPKKAKVTRRFLIVEGIYMKYGDICPLPKLIELKWKYKLRIFMDESFSFGVLGKTGRGVTEHFDISMDHIDMMTASLENAICAAGGFSCGREWLVETQRLLGLGYCFSASLPPMLVAGAIQSFNLLEKDPDILIRLRENCEAIHRGLSEIEGMLVRGDPIAPIKHLCLSEPSTDRDIDNHIMQKIADQAMTMGVALTPARYLEQEEHELPSPSIRVAVNVKLTEEEIQKVISTISVACYMVLDEKADVKGTEQGRSI